MILTRLSQLICQILNRISITGCFDFVTELDIPGMESISHFQILSAGDILACNYLYHCTIIVFTKWFLVSGILVAISLKGSLESRESAIKAIISDASFLPASLLFLIGKNIESGVGEHASSQKLFNMTNFEEVNEEECRLLQEMIQILIQRYQNKELGECEEIPDDDICTICFNFRKNAEILPCGHFSCRYLWI